MTAGIQSSDWRGSRNNHSELECHGSDDNTRKSVEWMKGVVKALGKTPKGKGRGKSTPAAAG